MTAQPLYTSTTGVESDVTVSVVEHAPSTTLRVTDQKYGLATAARKAFLEKQAVEKRAEFQAQKQAVLSRQWAKDVARKQSLLDQTLADVHQLEVTLLDEKVPAARKVAIEATRVRLQKKADTIFDEIEVLEAKLAKA